MGQIIYGKQKPKFCNLAAIQTGGNKANTVLASGEIWMVDTTNTTKLNGGAGVYDAYIVGDNSKVASALTINYLTATVDLSAYSTTAQMNTAIQSAISGKQDSISKVTVSVDNNTGTPSGSASVSGSTLTINLSNLKGAKGDTGAVGPAGANGVTTDATIAIVTGIDTTTQYDSTKDVASAEAVQDVLKMLGKVYYVATT